jgi:hypothetical protein
LELEKDHKLGYDNRDDFQLDADCYVFIIGKSLLVQLQQSFKMKIKKMAAHARFTAGFDPEVVERWSAMVDAWDLDPQKPNPYEEVGKGVPSV